jgi:hypothetical protein
MMMMMISRLEMISIKRASGINYKFTKLSTPAVIEFVSQIKCKLIQCRFREIIHDSLTSYCMPEVKKENEPNARRSNILFDQKDLFRQDTSHKFQ